TTPGYWCSTPTTIARSKSAASNSWSPWLPRTKSPNRISPISRTGSWSAKARSSATARSSRKRTARWFHNRSKTKPTWTSAARLSVSRQWPNTRNSSKRCTNRKAKAQRTADDLTANRRLALSSPGESAMHHVRRAALAAVTILIAGLPAAQALIDEDLADELQAMVEKSEKVHRPLLNNRNDSAQIQKAIAQEQQNMKRMKEIVQKHGWPGRSLVGEDGAKNAFLLVVQS